jgi:hypothetical protein
MYIYASFDEKGGIFPFPKKDIESSWDTVGVFSTYYS